MRRSAGRLGLLALAALAILAATILPGSIESGPPPRCLLCADNVVADAIANIVLYAPLGAAFSLLGWKWRYALVAGAALSGMVEILQLLIPGRHGTLLDVVTNSVGVAAGIGVVTSARWWSRPRAEVADRLALGAGLAFCGMCVLTSYMSQPALPRSQYWGQWTAIFPHLEVYRGTVLEARIGGVPLPSHRLADSDTVRDLLLAGTTLHVRVVAGPPVSGMAPIFSIADEWQRGILFLGASGDDLVFRLRRWAAALRLNQPRLSMVGALRTVAPGDTLEIAVRASVGGHCIDAGAFTSCRDAPTVGEGWTLLVNAAKLPAGASTGLNVLWLAGLAAPFGLWARRRRGSAAGALLIAGGLLLVPALPALAATGPTEYLGVALGLIAGRLLQRSV